MLYRCRLTWFVNEQSLLLASKQKMLFRVTDGRVLSVTPPSFMLSFFGSMKENVTFDISACNLTRRLEKLGHAPNEGATSSVLLKYQRAPYQFAPCL